MSKRAIFFLLVLVAAFSVAIVLLYRNMNAGAAPQQPPGGDFVLQAGNGPFDTATLRGQVVLVYFGYTYCPDICPTSLAASSEAFKQLTPDELAHVRLIFVSVDPQRDTPARLAEYAAFFHPNMIGVTGTPEQLAEVAKRYGAAYARQAGSEAGYVVDHSAWTYVVAPDGKLVGRLPHGAGIDQIVSTIRQWLPALTTSKGTS